VAPNAPSGVCTASTDPHNGVIPASG
jgi:hypothetical protein